MHELHELLCQQLREHLTARRVVVWYDPRREFVPFFEELCRFAPGSQHPLLLDCSVGGLPTKVAWFDASMLAIRSALEPLVAADQPQPVVVYLPGVERDRTGSVLMELEKAGRCLEGKKLKSEARTVLRRRHTDGVIDDMLAPDGLSYRDLVALIEQTPAAPSLLKVIFPGFHGPEEVLAAWLAGDGHDTAIEEKGAGAELLALVRSRLGLDLPAGTAIPEARAKTTRFALVAEFRSDLAGEPPVEISMIPAPGTKEQLQCARAAAERLREKHGASYVTLADQVESELGLRHAKVPAELLGSIDTFRFEERALLAHCDSLVASGKNDEALRLVEGRTRSFWVDKDVGRQAQWEACRRMAELGVAIEAVSRSIGSVGKDSASWVRAYAAKDGWSRLDQAQRRLEAWVATMDNDPEAERALARVRADCEAVLRKQAVSFTSLLEEAGWGVKGILHQTRVYPEVVEGHAGTVALFTVDALRYEMGEELSRLLPDALDVVLRPAVAALPTITPVGMAALLPGASGDFSVVAQQGKLGARVGGTFLPSLQARLKTLKARVPGAVDLELGWVLQASSRKVEVSLKDAKLVLVRSQELDALGEGSAFLARQVMDTVVANVARAIRKLAAAGIEWFVITADHGHQFSLEKGDDMKIDGPAGDVVEAHRRCWIGRGGSTPSGSRRVAGPELGYDTDLEFVFPTGLGVFKAGGGLAYHHGGTSLQELVIPVLSFRMTRQAAEVSPRVDLTLAGVPTLLANRTFGFSLFYDDMYSTEPIVVRPALMAAGQQVGAAGMAVDAELDRESGCVTLAPRTKASVGMLLSREDCEKVRLVILDPTTDAVLAQSDEIVVKLGV